MGNLKTKFLFQLIASLSYSLIPLITFPYIARTLGPEKVGTINFVDYTAQIFITAATFGIPLYAVREIAKVRDKIFQLQKIVSELFSIHIITSIISLITFILVTQLDAKIKNEPYLILLASINIFFNAFTFDWFIHGIEDFKTLSLRSLIVKALIATCIFLFIRYETDYLKYYLIFIVGSIAIIIQDIIYVRKKGITFLFSKNLRQHLKPLSIFFLTSASISLYTLLDTFLLGVLTTTLAVGYYTTVLKIIRLSQNFINDLGAVLMPRIAYLINKNDLTEISRIVHKSTLYVITIAIPLGLLFFLLAPEIIMLLAGTKYMSAVSTLKILSFLPLIIGFSNIFGIQVLIPYGKEKQLFRAVISGSIVSISLSFCLCPILKENGAAIAALVAEIVVTSIMGFYASHFVFIHFPLKIFISICLTSLVFVPYILFIKYIFTDHFIILSLSLIGCVLIYLIFQLFVFVNSILWEMIYYLKSIWIKFTFQIK